MCEIDVSGKSIKGKPSLNIMCKKSGKPISITNEFGMYCEDLCDIDEDKKAGQKLMKLLGEFERIGI